MQLQLQAKTYDGLEEILAEELKQLGAKNVKIRSRVVNFQGDIELLYRANYVVRTATKISMLIANSEDIRSKDDLEDFMSSISWHKYFSAKKKIFVNVFGKVDYFDKIHEVAWVANDEISEHFQTKFGRTPKMVKQNEDGDIFIELDVYENYVKVYLNSSNRGLTERGYETKTNHKAPLSSVAAAGLIKLSGWDQKTTLLDPMCGTGTIVFEAALQAYNYPSQYFRESFGFMRWKGFDIDLWDEIVEEENEKILEGYRVQIQGSDIFNSHISKNRKKAEAIEFSEKIKFSSFDFFDLPSVGQKKFIITNPTFIEEGDIDRTNHFFKRIGDTLRKDYVGSTAWILCPDLEVSEHIGMDPFQRIEMYDGTKTNYFLAFNVEEKEENK